MPEGDARPILVTGAHRAGTTWVGQMLCASGGAAYVHEPFNLIVEPGWVAPPFPYWYLYVTAENEHTYRDRIEPAFRLRFPLRGRGRRLFSVRPLVTIVRVASATGHRVRHRRPLVKDPLALFSAPWLADAFGAVPVVMIRHPAAFASSLQRLGWRFDFRNWLDQPLLMRDHLHRFEAELRRAASTRDTDLIDEAGLIWRVLYSTVADFQRRHPDWIFVRHEDLTADPMARFADVYRRLGLPWNGRAVAALARSTTGDEAEPDAGVVRPTARDSAAIGRLWASRMKPDEVRRLKDAVADVSPAFYSDDDWL